MSVYKLMNILRASLLSYKEKKVTVYSFMEQLCFMLRLFSVQEALT